MAVFCVAFSASAATAQVTGSGTTDYVPLWTSSTALGNSILYQTSGNVGINTTTPHYALDVVGHINSSLGYLIGEKLILTFPGGTTDNNIALGYKALTSNTTGMLNTASGYEALEKNTTGKYNVAIGNQALEDNESGDSNTACGSTALQLSTGSNNTASGTGALQANTSGSGNTASGAVALSGTTTGSNNIGIGYLAGMNLSATSDNIDIGSAGISGDSGVIRIGTGGTQTTFYAAGIYGVSSGNNDAIPVLVDTSGQLVTSSSSRRFKEDIHDMGDASSDLMRLRPVTFRYKKPLADGSQPIQYGLIAEEVAEVNPNLVARSADGQIETVKYQLLDPMLLNEVQRQQAEIRDLQERLVKMEAALASMRPLRAATQPVAAQPQVSVVGR